MVTKITNQEKNLIENAIRDAERLTQGEIVPIIFSKSSEYLETRYKSAIAFAFIATFLSLVFPTEIKIYFTLLFFFIGAVIGYYLSAQPTILRWLTPNRTMDEEVHERALFYFYTHGLRDTKKQTGVLIYISLLEHRVELIADQAINDKVTATQWSTTVDHLILQIKAGKMIEGFINSIQSCGMILSQYFPKDANDTNELSNRLISDIVEE